MAENTPILLEARAVSCAQSSNGEPHAQVRDVSLAIREGTMNVITGDIADGGNLLLRLLGLLDVPEEGEILLRGAATRGLAEEARTELRNRHYGFVFAEPFLLPAFSVVENVAMPLFKISGVGPDEAQLRTHAMLEFTGMMDCAHWVTNQLTFAQQQRTALARALVNRPEILVVENADAEVHGGDAEGFIALVRHACLEFGITAILTAKDAGILKPHGRIVEMAGGEITRDSGALEKGAA